MRPIHLVRLDKWRPAVILTRDKARPLLNQVTVAPITSTARGLPSEVLVGPCNGIDHESVVNCDLIDTVLVDNVGAFVGTLLEAQETALTAAIHAAFDLQ